MFDYHVKFSFLLAKHHKFPLLCCLNLHFCWLTFHFFLLKPPPFLLISLNAQRQVFGPLSLRALENDELRRGAAEFRTAGFFLFFLWGNDGNITLINGIYRALKSKPLTKFGTM